jgi:FkbM family methyltransferase
LSGFYEREYSYKQRCITWISRRSNFTYTCRRGVARGLKRKGGLGFLPSFGAPGPEEAFLRNLDLHDKVIYDVGAFEGLMTLLFASRGRRVIAFEPNPDAAARIRENLAANHFDHVTLREVAMGDTPGHVTLVYDELMSGGASGDPKAAAALRESAPRPRSVEAQASTIDAEIAAGLPVPDFVKIDVEGMECAVLRGMRNLLSTRKPWLYFELHGTAQEDKLRNARTVIDGLRSYDYRIFDIERGADIAPGDSVTGRESHIFAS